tara:strand:+ start:263 stop:472 length:210 start_codon:yes stop_codon:yes gene_type:complete
MTSTYISKARRSELIDEYMDCWIETESWDGCEQHGVTPEQATSQMRSQLESMNNSQLIAEIKASSWEIL